MKAYFTELIKFTGVGVVGTTAHYSVLIIIIEVLKLSAYLGTACGFFTGATVNYILAKRFVFDASNSPVKQSLSRFYMVVILGAVENQIVFSLLVSIWHYLVAQVIATGLVFMCNFLLIKYWVFRSVESIPNDTHV